MTPPHTELDRPNSYIGRSVSRPNAKRLLSGRGRYVTDLRLPRMLHAAFFRSPYAHARIIAIETSQAASAPGVRLVATGEDLAKLCKPWVGTLDHFKGMKSPPQLPLAVGKVVWAGQPIVAVVAETRAKAEDALELIIVEFEDLEPVTDMMPHALKMPPSSIRNSGETLPFSSRSSPAWWMRPSAHAASVVEDTLTFGRHTAVTLEPRAIIADYDPSEERLTVHHATQTPYQFQDLYSRHYGLHEARVRVVAPDIGGSFGMKLHVYHSEDMAVVGLSMMLGRPVKFVADWVEL